MQRESYAKWLLIAGLAFVFGYFGIDKFVHPDIWIGWMPMWMEGLMGMTREMWLPIIGASEVMLAVMLIIPVRIIQRIGAILVALHLVAILTQVGWNDIGIREIGLLMSALSLAFLL